MSSDADRFPVEDIVFGHPIAERSCGDCVACCRLLTIDDPELQKPAMVLCPNCTGTACRIHEARPAACRIWFCAWRRIESMPLKTRPDRLGVMFEVMRPEAPRSVLERLYIRAVALTSWEDFARPDMQPVIEMLRQTRLPVWLDHEGRMECVHPSPAIQAVLIAGRPASTAAVAAEAAEWRRACELL